MKSEVTTAVFGLPGARSTNVNVRSLPLASARAVVSQLDRPWRAVVIDRLQELTALPVGWDGYSAPPVNFANAEFALRMLEAICSSECIPPQIVPGNDGDLQIEWHTSNGSIELHVMAPNSVHAWRSGIGSLEDELALTNDFTVVVGWLRSQLRERRAPSTSAA